MSFSRVYPLGGVRDETTADDTHANGGGSSSSLPSSSLHSSQNEDPLDWQQQHDEDSVGAKSSISWLTDVSSYQVSGRGLFSPSIHSSIYLYLLIPPSIHLSILPSIYASNYLCILPSIYPFNLSSSLFISLCSNAPSADMPTCSRSRSFLT